MLNEALRLVRLFHNQSQTQVAEGIGFSKSYISEIEAGKKKVSLDVLDRYSQHFKIPASSLMFFAERAAAGTQSETIRVYVAAKVINMLDWLAAITDAGSAEGGSRS
ncbi:MAG: helix-turn-helix transcriptional regulator [Planctomycetota bacterium]